MSTFDDLQGLLSSVLNDDAPEPEPTPEPEEAGTITTRIAADGTRTIEATGAAAKLALPGTDIDIDSLFDDQTEEESLVAPLNPTPEPTTAPEPEAELLSACSVPMPTFTTDELAQSLDLRNFATLVKLNTARWHAKVKDRKASKNAAAATGADEHAFETRKRLLVGADEKLKRIHKAIDAARTKHYELTLPWTTVAVDDVGRRTGSRLLPNTLFEEYIAAMAESKKEMDSALDDFVPDYPNLIEQAKLNLKGSFDANEYPNPESIRRHFDLSFDFDPIPAGTDFKGLAASQCQKLADAIEDKQRKMVENAMQDLWMRLHDAVYKMEERLSTPDKQFHHTLVGNIKTIAKLLGHLNVTNDPFISSLQTKVESCLCQHDVKELRENPTIRMRVASYAKDILIEMEKHSNAN